ncbi:MAG: flavin monoamine oxidase family protein [Pseudanabaenaceae cyanobacterium]
MRGRSPLSRILSRLLGSLVPPHSYRRRRFLKLAALAGGGFALANCAAPASKTSPPIAVIGAGLAGLSAAFHLQKQGLVPTVYEGRSRLGGRVYTQTQVWGTDTYLDLGAVLVNTDHTEVKTLCQELGISLYERQGIPNLAKVVFFFEDRRIPMAEMAEALAPLAAQLAADAKLLDEDFDQYAPALDRLSVTAYLNQHQAKIRQPFGRSLLQAALRSEYGSEPEELSSILLLYLLPAVKDDEVEVLSQSDEAYTILGGSSQLAEGLAAKLTTPVQWNRVLKAVTLEGETYRLTFADGSTETAAAVILTLPPPALRRVDLAVPLPETLRRYIQEIQLGRNEKQFGRFQKRVWHEPGGFSDACWSDRTFCTGWDDSVRVGSTAGTFTFFHGGKEVAALQQQSPAAWQQTLQQTLGRMLNRTDLAALQRSDTLRSAWSNDPFSQGSYTRFAPGQVTAFAKVFYTENSTPVFGNLAFAGEHFSEESWGYMNGALETGRRAAEAIAQNLKPQSR